ncbi:hypothetical protein CPB84DRAFT_1683853 [Gymnopilus junonius]|uniref:Malic enzyme n=1 Tax=Gymnopilus junonius TaxID=109634 RepID=A0A9P5NJV2_GYMJU|nr:hypothetical protein CPB84DRAFT_1683853 [Gymnopilus junonius]
MAALHDHKPAHLVSPLRIALRGQTLLTSPRYNKGTAFPSAERKTFGLEGRLPYRTNTLEEQCERAYGQLESRDLAIRKNTFLQSLKEQNLTLYYALLARHLKELTPIIYTPTEAEAITSYSQLFRRSEGLFLSFPDEHIMEELFLEETRGRDIELIVVTDGEAILGIGDQGVGISTAKSVIYTLIGGMEPAKSLPVVLDVGTDNQNLLNDPLYVGWPKNRVRGEGYDRFVDKFVQLVRKHYPKCLLHFEDFGVTNARRILDRYRDTHAVFNDDIQGTGAVTLACIMSAIRISSLSRASASSPEKKKLSDQRYVIFGAGSAGLGIATQLRDAIISADGLSRQDANRKFWLIDRDGLLHDKLKINGLTARLQELVRPVEENWGEKSVSLLEVVERMRPTVLIGCSTKGGAFTKEVVEAMMCGLDEGAHPIILPLSNPSRLAEATPEDLMHWTKGRALIATGSPFENVKVVVDGKEKEIAECNNALIYPGLGFGAVLSKSRSMTDTMLIAGAKRLAALSPALSTAASDDEYNGAALLPDFVDAPKVNFEVAITVAEQAIREGTASEEWKIEEVRQKASEKVWIPVYPEYIYDEQGIRRFECYVLI